MSAVKAYLVPIRKEAFEKNPKYKILKEQITSSLYLIAQGIGVTGERLKLQKVWSSFLTNVIEDYGDKSLPIRDDEQYGKVLRYITSKTVEDKLPWFTPDVIQKFIGGNFSDYSNCFFAVVPTNNSDLAYAIDNSTNETVYNDFSEDLLLRNVKSTIELINDSVRKSKPLPLVGIGHQEFSQNLHKYIYNSQGQNNTRNSTLNVVYSDGSVGNEINVSPIQTDLNTLKTYDLDLKAGLISNRHFKIDAEIDFYLINNSEITLIGREYSFAEQEEFAFRKIQEFTSMVLRDRSLRLSVYPSGLEPANVGLLRLALENVRNINSKAFELKLYQYAGKEKGFHNYILFR